MNCERCSTDKEARRYDPRVLSRPTKRVWLCDECAAKDPKATLDEEQTMPTKKVESKVKEIVDLTPPNEKPVEKPVEPLPKTPKPDGGAVNKDEIWKKLKTHEEDVDKLFASRAKLIKQLQGVNEMIVVKKGAIASLRDVLGVK